MSTRVNEVKKMIREMFDDMNGKIPEIIEYSRSSKDASEKVMEYVSSTVSSDALGFMSYLYSGLADETLQEDIFKDVVNANRFYEAGLRKKIVDVYSFDIDKLPVFEDGIDFKEINQAYATAGAAVGSAAVGGILLGVISGVVKLPIIVIIAGAVLAGVIGAGVAHTTVPKLNKKNFESAVLTFMTDLEKSMIDWVDDVVRYYNEQVEEIKKIL